MKNINKRQKIAYILVIAIMVSAVICGGYLWREKIKIQQNQAIFQEAQKLENAEKYKEAISKYEEAAVNGDPVSLVTLGNIYYYGKIVSQDHAKAVSYFKDAAKLNSAESPS